MRNISQLKSVVANNHVGRDADILPQIAVGANPAVLHDMAEVPDLGAEADLAIAIDI